jgi:ABC-type branched-subunit amino acid transport system substrate-binding protein
MSQLFLAGAADIFADSNFPWTKGLNPALVTEAHIYARHIRSTKPNAMIGVLFQNDVLGKPFLKGIRERLGSGHGDMIVKEASYEVYDPTVDSQIVAIQGAGADTLVIVSAPKPAAQAIRKAYDIGWMPQRHLFSGSASIPTTFKPDGLDKSKGVITASCPAPLKFLEGRHAFSCERQRPLVGENKSIQHALSKSENQVRAAGRRAAGNLPSDPKVSVCLKLLTY